MAYHIHLQNFNNLYENMYKGRAKKEQPKTCRYFSQLGSN